MSNSCSYIFKSILSPYLERLIEIKVAAGQHPVTLHWKLKEFDEFAVEYGLSTLDFDDSFLQAWHKSRIADSERTLYAKYSVWNQLTRLMQRLGCKCVTPQMPRFPNPGFVPYIFTKLQIENIFIAVDNQRIPIKNMNYALFPMPAILRTLYATGMRVSEVLALNNYDVNLSEGYIMVRKTKNKKQRVIPVSDSLNIVLTDYVQKRNELPLSSYNRTDGSFFIKPDGTSISELSVYNCFRKVLKQVGIEYKGNHAGPRVHDLRHTFAVHSLAKMAIEDVDIYAALPVLSAILGHATLKSTEAYVRLTAEQFPEIEKQLKESNLFEYPKYNPKDEEL